MLGYVVSVVVAFFIATSASFALTCDQLFKLTQQTQMLPRRSLEAGELARFAQAYALENKHQIIQQLQAAQPGSDGRIYVKLAENDHISIWAHRWIGVPTDIHDHVDSRAGIYVLKGSLREEIYQPPNPVPQTRVLEEGRAVGMHTTPYTHRVYGFDDSISVHVYSPQLRNMSFYQNDPESGLLTIERRWSGKVPKLSARPEVRSNSNGLVKPFDYLSSRDEILSTPIAISSYAQLVGYRHFTNHAGLVVGKAFLIRPLQENTAEFPNHKGDLQFYKTEIDATNHNLFELLGFEESFEPGYGRYMSQVPDAQLFTYLKTVYNNQVPDALQIHVGVYASAVVSAHQTEIVTNWVRDANVTMGNPLFGSVLGTAASDLANPVINGKEKLSTFRHDLEHFGSIVLIPKEVVTTNQQVGKFWQRLLAKIKELENLKNLPKNYRSSTEFRAIMDAVYLYNRRFHSLTHVLGMLVRAHGMIDINQQRILDFGQSAETETPTVHWSGLGFKPSFVNHDNLPFPNRLFDVSLENSRSDRSIVTIADAYDMVTNDAVNHARRFTKDFFRKFPNSPLSGFLNLLHEYGINDQALLSEKELVHLQNLTLQRYQLMGNSGVYP